MRRVTVIAVSVLVISVVVEYLLVNAPPKPGAAPAKPVVTGAIERPALPATASSRPEAVPPEPAATGVVDRPSALPPAVPHASAEPALTETLGRACTFLVAMAQALDAAALRPVAIETTDRASAVPATPPPAALDAAPARPAVTEATDRASALFEAGKFAKAKDVLDCFVAAPPAGAHPQELRNAQLLLDRVKGALVDDYRAVQVARERSTAEESRRAVVRDVRQACEKKMLADADRLFHQAQAGIAPESNFEEARRLYAQVASERALEAFNSAMASYDEGQYEGAQKVFERLSKFLDQQRAGDPQFQSPLGQDREQRIAECLKRLPDAGDNLALGALLAKGPVASTR